MHKNRSLVGISLLSGLAFVAAFLLITPVQSSPDIVTELPVSPSGNSLSGLDPVLVEQMLAVGIPLQAINPNTAAEFLAHQAWKTEGEARQTTAPVSLENGLPDALVVEQPIEGPSSSAIEKLWEQIELAFGQNDRQTLLYLADQLPEAERTRLLAELNRRENESPTHPSVIYFIGVNGNKCAYSTFSAAMTAASAGDTLYVRQGTWIARIGSVAKDLHIRAASNDCTTASVSEVTLDANDTAASYGGMADIAASVHVTFTNLILTNGSADYGGILYVRNGANVILDNTDLTQGVATYTGGGLRIYEGTVTVKNGSQIRENMTVQDDGGGVAIYQGTLYTWDTSSIGSPTDPNQSGKHGGGIMMNGGTLIMHGTSQVSSNIAAENGGGLFATNEAYIELHNNSQIGGLNSNMANQAVDGGGVYVTGTHTTFTMVHDSLVGYNSASRDGGGIYAGPGTYVVISSASINNNQAQNRGGGFMVDGNPTISIQNDSTVNYNQTTNLNPVFSMGGGMYILGNGSTITLTASSMLSNTSSGWYGGIRLNGESRLRLLDGANISYNHANGGSGGGIAISFGSAVINNAILHYNKTSQNGGGIFMHSGDLLATDPDIRFNTANNNGGGIYHTGGTLSMNTGILDSYLAVNSASTGNGGGIYDSSGGTLAIYALGNQTFNLNTNHAIDGGAIYATNGTSVDIWGKVMLTSNWVDNNGGAIAIEGNSLLRLDDFDEGTNYPTIWVNTANNGNGGGIYTKNSPVVELYGVEVGGALSGNNATLGHGGGIYIDNSNLHMDNTRLRNNLAGGNGGGLAADQGSNVLIEAIFPVYVIATKNPDMPMGFATQCNPWDLPANRYCSEILGNTAAGYGGGVFIDHGTHATISYTAFLSNTGFTGAAIEIMTSTATLNNSLLSGNHAMNTLNNSIVHVYAGYDGIGSAIFKALHNTWAGNPDMAIYYAQYTSGYFNNNIVWGNGSLGSVTPNVTAVCNDTQDGALIGIGNISQDPRFITTLRGNYRLGAQSPAVDQCTTGSHDDLDHTSRPIGSGYDMGAFEANAIYLPLVMR